MEELIFRRTRAKTPVFRVGQLESKQPYDAKVLAERYQAILPARLMSPFVEVPEGEIPEILHTRTIRKIKRQDSLRSLMKKHSRDGSISDTETLVGSTPTSPLSPSYPEFKKYDSFDEHVTVEDLDLKDTHSSFDNDMALKICMDLLTNELSTAIVGEPTAHRQSSGLQILLMIESYERVQQHLRQEKYKSQAGGKSDVQDVERILEYWLKVLYSVYDRSYDHNSRGNEEHYPLPLSVSRPPARHPGRSFRDYGATFGGLGGDVYDREGMSF